MNFLFFYILILAHPYLAMWWTLFEKAGRPKWEALVPGYNYFVAFKITCHKPFWSLLLLFPGVHLVMLATVNTSLIRRFGYYSFLIALFKFKKSLNLRIGTAIFFPLPFLYYKKSYLNLMPLDIAINWMYEISEDEKSVGLIFHICNPSPFLIRDIFKQTFKVFNLIMPIVGVPKTLAYIYFTLINVTAKIITPLKPIALRIHHFKWYLLEHVYYNMSNTRNFIKNDIDTHFLASKDHIFEVASAVVCKLELYKKK